MKDETRCIHGEGNLLSDHAYGSVTTPVYLSATFAHPDIGVTTGYAYTRTDNPTRHELESIISSLEQSADTLACSSGMAAINLLFELFSAGDEWVCTEDLYGGSVRVFDNSGVNRGLSFHYLDTSDLSALEAAMTEHTKAVYIETPSNPTMAVTDLRRAAEIAHKHGALLIVDNTFMSPYLQTPLTLGADIVVHSGTKYIAGHNDVVCGFVSTKDEEIAQKLRVLYNSTGCILSSFDSYLVIRGLKTLAIRMDRQQENADRIAHWLLTSPVVSDVLYVGLPSHPGYETNKAQAKGAGAMISFHVDTQERARKFLQKLKVIAFAESLGGVESLATYPLVQTHAAVPEETRQKLGINETLIRLSVGIENVEDLIEDIKQALAD